MASSSRIVRLAVVTLLAATLAWAGAARAQAVDFVASQGPWSFGGYSTGIATSNDGLTLYVDTNGNGGLDAGDLSYPTPAAIQGAPTMRLSPTRQVLYAVSASTVRFYELPPVSGQPLVAIGAPVTVPNGVADLRFFDHGAAASQRIACIVDGRSPTLTQDVWWVDLASGATAHSSFPFLASVGTITFAANGIEAFVQHSLGGGSSSYSFVSLCTATLGTIDNPGGAGLSGLFGGPPVAASFDSLGTTYVRATCSCLAPPGYVLVAVSNCATTPVTGAACLAGGGCIDGVTPAWAASAGATWLGAGTTCGIGSCPSPPMVVLSVSVSAPASATSGAPITYTITGQNNGNMSSSSLVLSVPVPPNGSFVSATGGGTNLAGVVRWNVASLAPGGSISEQIVVSAPCSGSSVTLSGASLFGIPGGTVYAVSRTTTLSAGSTAAMGFSVRSTASAPVPLHPGAVITHHVRLDNSAGPQRSGIRFSAIVPYDATFGTTLASAGGSVTTGGATFSWTGSLAAGAIDSVVFTTVVSSCRSTSITSELLNRGGNVTLTNACTATLGTASIVDTFPLAPPPVTCALWHVNGHVPGGSPGFTVVRPGDTMELQLRVTNNETTPQGPVAMRLPIGSGFTPVGNPPFVGTPPAGTTWDAGASTLHWDGTLAVGQTVSIAFRAQIDPAQCRATLTATGDTPGCTNTVSGSIAVATSNPPPASSVLVGLHPYYGVWAWDPANPGTSTWLLCVSSESMSGMDVAPNADLWISGLRSMRFNPTTLFMEQFRALETDGPHAAFTTDLGLINGVGFVGGNQADWFAPVSGGGGQQLRRWDDATKTWTTILGGAVPPVVSSGAHFVEDPDGWVAFANGASVIRVNAHSPGTYVTYGNAMIAWSTCIARDTDGNYLVAEYAYGSTAKRTLAKIDRATGAYTEVVHDLNALVPLAEPPYSMTVAPNGDVYLADTQGRILRVTRGGTPAAQLVWTAGATSALGWLQTGGVVAVDPAPAPAPLAFALREPAPNPSTGETTLRFTLPADGRVALDVLDVNGRLVARVADGTLSAGEHAVRWGGRDAGGRPLAAGVYFARLAAGGRTLQRKLVVIH